MSKMKTHEQYVNELINNSISIVPLSSYSGALTKIEHRCDLGHIWNSTPSNILSGRGCPECHRNSLKSNTEEYKSKLYSKSISHLVLEEYINSSTPINHLCKNNHIWKASPNNILKGRGCPYCATFRFNLEKPAILYYIKILNTYYKIGVTNRTIQDRFRPDKDKQIKILLEKEFDTGLSAKLAEQSILKKYEVYRVTSSILKSGGNTELFLVDVLGLDCT